MCDEGDDGIGPLQLLHGGGDGIKHELLLLGMRVLLRSRAL
jgi:hypothetical protein